MSAAPAVSVIVPSYNRAGLLARAIDSVLGQTFGDLELIVVDDGSTDETARILGGYTDLRLVSLRHPERRGAAAARNTGIRASRGRLLAFQDSDDCWAPTKLARQVAALRAAPPQVAVVYCRFRHIGARRAALHPSHAQLLAARLGLPGRRIAGDLAATLLRGNFISTQTALIRRTCLLDVGGFDERLGRFQDWDLWLRIARRYQFTYLGAPLVTTYAAPARISDDGAALETAFARLTARHAGAHPRGYELVAQQRYARGLAAWRRAGPRPGLALIVRALALSPANSAYWAAATRAALSIALPQLHIAPPRDYLG